MHDFRRADVPETPRFWGALERRLRDAVALDSPRRRHSWLLDSPMVAVAASMAVVMIMAAGPLAPMQTTTIAVVGGVPVEIDLSSPYASGQIQAAPASSTAISVDPACRPSLPAAQHGVSVDLLTRLSLAVMESCGPDGPGTVPEPAEVS